MHVIGVDVGTSSVRVAITRFKDPKYSSVELVASQTKNIKVHKDDKEKNKIRFEQSSAEIWAAICECTRACLKNGRIHGQDIEAIAFSATCSLVVWSDPINTADNSLYPRDIIMWMDHRAIDEAKQITETDKKVCKQFGGICSPEFTLSKLLWLKEHDSQRFESAKGFFELPDWLVYRCIGGDPSKSPRSLNCLTSKWGYNAEEKCHCYTLQKLLQSSPKNVHDKFGYTYLSPGMRSEKMSLDAAIQLGLMDPEMSFSNNNCNNNKSNCKSDYTSDTIDIAVVTSLIDAHAGMLAMLSIANNDELGIKVDLDSTLCSLTGTSCCHLSLSKERKFHNGIWGPYKDVILEDYYLLEAGQSFAGELIDKTIANHYKSSHENNNNSQSNYDCIINLNEQIMDDGLIRYLPRLHILPFNHGNRSPLANPQLLGGMYGLNSDCDISLLERYAATVEALVCENRLIIDNLDKKPATILVSGGLMKNSYYMQTLANILNCKVVCLGMKSIMATNSSSQPQQKVNEIDLMTLGSCLLAKHAIRSPYEPLTRENMIQYRFPGLESREYIPQVDLIEHYEKRYRSFKCFVEFSLKMNELQL